MDTKDETTGKYPTGTSNTEVDEYLKTTATTNEKKKREFEPLLMSEYAKFKSWSDAFMNLIKTAQSEYPHNVTSDGKEMYIWGDDKVIPYTGRRTGKNFTTTAKSMKSAQVKTAASMKERITSTLEFAALHNAWDVSDHEDILGPESRRDTLKSLTLTWAHCYPFAEKALRGPIVIPPEATAKTNTPLDKQKNYQKPPPNWDEE